MREAAAAKRSRELTGGKKNDFVLSKRKNFGGEGARAIRAAAILYIRIWCRAAPTLSLS
jgi:hypothetical protein